MIVLHTDYDLVATILSGYAVQLGAPNFVHKHQVTAASLQGLLAVYAGPNILCFFGHGDNVPPRMRDQNKIHVLSAVPGNRFHGWVVYGACCYSRDAVGQQLMRDGATVIGFTDELLIPDTPLGQQELARCLLEVPRALARGQLPAAAVQAAKNVFKHAANQLYTANLYGEAIGLLINKKRFG